MTSAGSRSTPPAANPRASARPLIVSDMVRFRIRTNWTNSVSRTHEFELEDLADASTRDRCGQNRPDEIAFVSVVIASRRRRHTGRSPREGGNPQGHVTSSGRQPAVAGCLSVPPAAESVTVVPTVPDAPVNVAQLDVARLRLLAEQGDARARNELGFKVLDRSRGGARRRRSRPMVPTRRRTGKTPAGSTTSASCTRTVAGWRATTPKPSDGTDAPQNRETPAGSTTWGLGSNGTESTVEDSI